MTAGSSAQHSRDQLVRVAIIDDHRLLGESLAAALRAGGYAVTLPPLTSLEDISAGLASEPPSVALLDVDLGGIGSGLAQAFPG